MVTIALDVDTEIGRATHLFGRAAILNFAGSHRASAIVRPSCKIRQYQNICGKDDGGNYLFHHNE